MNNVLPRRVEIKYPSPNEFEVQFRDTGKSCLVRVTDNSFIINGTSYRLVDFFKMIDEIIKCITVGWKGTGKLAKAPEFIQLKCIRASLGKRLGKLLAGELRKLHALANQQYLAFDKMVFSCSGTKITFNALSHLYGQSFWQDGNFVSDILKYRAAMHAFLDLYVHNYIGVHDCKSFDWIAFYAFGGKKTHILEKTLKSIRYVLPAHAMRIFKNHKVHRILNTKLKVSTFLTYCHTSRTLKYKLVKLILDSPDKDFKKACSLLRKAKLIDIKLTRYSYIETILDYLNRRFDTDTTLVELAKRIILEEETKFRNKIQVTDDVELPPLPKSLLEYQGVESFTTVGQIIKERPYMPGSIPIKSILSGDKYFFKFKNNWYTYSPKNAYARIEEYIEVKKIPGIKFIKKAWEKRVKS